MTEVSSTRLYLGNLPKHATKDNIEEHFKCMAGTITEIKLMNGFGFIEYKDPMDARDVVPAFHGSDFMGERLTVQFARGTRNRETNGFGTGDRLPPRPRRTQHRLQISGFPQDTSWQDLKDFARQAGLNVVYSEVNRDLPGEGFVEFETDLDLRTAVDKLHNKEFSASSSRIVSCVADPQPNVPVHPPPRDFRNRSRSPIRNRRGPSSHGSHHPGTGPHGSHGFSHGPHFDDYDRRGPPPPRGYSPRRDAYRGPYRDRSPHRRDYYDDRRGGYRTPPRRPPHMDGYGRRPPYDDPYRREYAPPAPPPDMYGRPSMYDRGPRDYPPRDSGYPPREAYAPHDYDRGHYW